MKRTTHKNKINELYMKYLNSRSRNIKTFVDDLDKYIKQQIDEAKQTRVNV